MSIEFTEKILINENKIDEYFISARDALFQTGIPYFSSNIKDKSDFKNCSFFPFTLIPSPFLRNEYELAIKVQLEWNNLMMKFSSDSEIINEALKE